MHDVEVTDESDTAIQLLIAPGADATMFFMLAFTKSAVVISALAVRVDVALVPPAGARAVAADQVALAHFVADAQVAGWPKMPAFETEMAVLSLGAVIIDAESGVTCISQTMEIIAEALGISFTKRSNDLPQWNTITSKTL